MAGGRSGRSVVAVCAVALLLNGCAASSPSARPDRPHHRQQHSPHQPTHHPTPRPAQPEPDARQPWPKGPISRGWRVYDVVDGDTAKVQRGRRELTVRLIGIDTPETVDPGEPVQCYGPESSAFAQRTLAGRQVLLERDPSQGRLDYYGRTLAYVWVVRPGERPWSYELAAVRRGYAFEYTYDLPYLWQREFQRAERVAHRHHRGLWSPRTCGGDPYRGT